MNYPELHSYILLPPKEVKVKVERSNISWYEPDGIYCTVNFKDPPPTSLSQIKEIANQWIIENGDKKICWLTVVDGGQQFDKEVRDYLAELLPKTIQAMALIAENALAKMAANMFFKLKKQDYPVQVFTDVEKAKQWLRKYL